MLRLCIKHMIALHLVSLFFLTGTAGASDLVLKDIQFAQSDQGEQIHFILSSYSPPEIFGIEGSKPRVVCDFANVKLAKEVKRSMETRGKMIHSVRVGIHTAPKPMTRVVLDLTPGPDYDIQQTYSTEKSRYTITVGVNKDATPDKGAAAGQ